MSRDSILVKSFLKDFIVVHKLILMLGTPVKLADRESPRVDRVNDLTINCSGSSLLYLGQV